MNKGQVFYRVTYDEKGIYEALKNEITIEEWKKLIASDKFNWLPKPTIYNDNNRSYFTKMGYEKFKEETLPIIGNYLSRDKIKIEESDNVKKIIYSDQYQIISIIDL